MASDWKKSEASPTWDFEENKEFVGVYVNKKEKVGSNSSNMYEFKVAGETVGVWGSTVIDARMNDIPLGSEVKIMYLGEATSPSSGRSYKNYDIYFRPLTKG